MCGKFFINGCAIAYGAIVFLALTYIDIISCKCIKLFSN